jgi:hypothetical protein
MPIERPEYQHILRVSAQEAHQRTPQQRNGMQTEQDRTLFSIRPQYKIHPSLLRLQITQTPKSHSFRRQVAREPLIHDL